MAGFIAAVGYVDCDHILVVTFLTISWAFSGLIGVGPNVSVLDMSPQHAGRHYFLFLTSTAIVLHFSCCFIHRCTRLPTVQLENATQTKKC